MPEDNGTVPKTPLYKMPLSFPVAPQNYNKRCLNDTQIYQGNVNHYDILYQIQLLTDS